MKIIKKIFLIIMLVLSITSAFAKTECDNPIILKMLKDEFSQSVEKNLDLYFYYRQKLFNPYFAEYMDEEKEKLDDLARSQKYSPEEFNQILKEKIKNIYKDANSKFIGIVKQQKVEEDDSTYQYNQAFEKLLDPYIDYQLSKQQQAMMREYDGEEDAMITSHFKTDPSDEKLFEEIVQNSFNIQFTDIQELSKAKVSTFEITSCYMTLNLKQKNTTKNVNFKYSVYFDSLSNEMPLFPSNFYINDRESDFKELGHYLIQEYGN
ncbi:hypothetical protein [Acinetobacter sp. WCHAc060025]|uniref:hypothetical protein n=1 Tax=Acinetobacter sp. WCHAc060025 TaxID=2518625 RepID=UPI0010231BF9|nr:hypothetical protein [Acinetobacter sp. WCHAc060025]RZG72908.1 hypothetical protein EXE09_16130 [Acinetobacter sp. WCHAc060025]